MYDYMYNCRHLFKGKLLDIGFPAIGEKMKLVRQMAKKFYKETKQRGAIQVGFMISKDLELMSQNGTFYDVLDGVIVKMNPIRPCRDLCCVNLRPGDGDSIEMIQDLELMSQNGTFYDVLDGVIVKMNSIRPCRDLCCVNLRPGDGDSIEMFQVSCVYARAPNFICQKQGKIKAKGQ
ncbi:unnamed protein product [Gongylonema pulchrum]|uniref:DNA-directed RNA polymerase n=1 Tax=Gongylonema pulchrum TaxID=637853 RepID=A0A183EV76_9BILA|nr:unnamed protein product [Gongylonema pulchrum]